MVFIYLALFPLVLGFIFKKKIDKSKTKKIYLFICFFQLFFFYAFRSIDIGTDTLTYVNTYKFFNVSEYYSIMISHYEIGFKFLYYILKYFNANPQWVLIVSGLIIHLGFSNFIYKNSKNIVLSTFIFSCLFFPNSMNIMRQYIAVAIAINSLQYILQKKYINAIFLILVGALFHKIVLILLVFLLMYILNSWRLIIFMCILAILLVVFFPIQILGLLRYFSNSFSYYVSDQYSVLRFMRFTTLLTFFIFILLFYSYYKKRYFTNISELKLYTYIGIVNFMFGILYLQNESFSRVIEILNIYLIISGPMIMTELRSYYKPLIRIAIYLVPLILLLNSVFNSGSGVENYKFFI